MKGVDLYLKVRHAVRIEGLSERAAARRFGIDPRTVNKRPQRTPVMPTSSPAANAGMVRIVVAKMPKNRVCRLIFRLPFIRNQQPLAFLSAFRKG
jgi:hypothetical protein